MWKLSPTSTLWTQLGMLIKLVFVQVLNIFLFFLNFLEFLLRIQTGSQFYHFVKKDALLS